MTNKTLHERAAKRIWIQMRNSQQDSIGQMVMKAIQPLIERGTLTVKQLYHIGLCSDQTVYNWQGGRGAPDLTTLNLWMRGLPEPVPQLIASVILTGCDFKVVPSSLPDKTELDVTGDGIIDSRDTGSHMMNALCMAADSAKQIQLTGAKCLNESDKAALRVQIHETMEELYKVEATLNCAGMRVARTG